MKDKVMRILGIMLLLALTLQACGRKGPLFLPPPMVEPQAASQVVPAQPATENPESKK